MILIKHRVNKIKDILSLSPNFGAEIDIRYRDDELILDHDPFSHHKDNLVSLREFMHKYHKNNLLILNVKSEGIEKHCIDIMREFNFTNWFFLDISMPYFVKYSFKAHVSRDPIFNKNNLAVRFSDEEPIEYAAAFANRVRWIWVDIFKKSVLTQQNIKKLKSLGFKICLVSPELQNHPIEFRDEFIKSIDLSFIDAVCTKDPLFWQKIYK